MRCLAVCTQLAMNSFYGRIATINQAGRVTEDTSLPGAFMARWVPQVHLPARTTEIVVVVAVVAVLARLHTLAPGPNFSALITTGCWPILPA